MSHQRGTPVNALYHRRLAVLLADDPGVRLRAHVARRFELDYVSRLDHLLAEHRVDGVMVHIRVTLTGGARAFVPVTVDGRRVHRLNPAMFHRGHHLATGPIPANPARDADAYGEGDENVQDLPPPGRRIAGFRLRNLNQALGVLAGLGGWAVEDELLRFDALARACKERGIPLFVLGPTPTTLSWWAGRVTRRANDAIRRRLAGTGVPYALLEGTTDGSGRPLVRADGFHLTPDGHRFVAERLYEGGMREWVGGLLERP
jgi:hypothetical protein